MKTKVLKSLSFIETFKDAIIKEKDAETFSDSDAIKKQKQIAARRRKNPILCGGKEVKSLIPATKKPKKIVMYSSDDEIQTEQAESQIDLNNLFDGDSLLIPPEAPAEVNATDHVVDITDFLLIPPEPPEEAGEVDITDPLLVPMDADAPTVVDGTDHVVDLTDDVFIPRNAHTEVDVSSLINISPINVTCCCSHVKDMYNGKH